MYEVVSQTITENYKAEQVPLSEWRFQIPNGNTGVVEISDPLIDSETLATERADSEFLKNSYKLKKVSFATYITGIALNDIINIHGLPYIVKSITVLIDQVKIASEIQAQRYE